jgi:hypothetical protein
VAFVPDTEEVVVSDTEGVATPAPGSTLTPVVEPPLPLNKAFTVKSAVAGQPASEKSIVMPPVAEPPAGMSPIESGNEVFISGVHGVPEV